MLKITEKPSSITWSSLFLVSLIAGIGFTMSIFVSELAFIHNLTIVNIAKMAILLSSAISITISLLTISIYVCINKFRNDSTNLINRY